ncbi:MAG: PEP/pyruvate-binding domain-containing protein, partial [Chloroflexota bacterium]
MASGVRHARKLVYRFDEGDASMSGLLGGKGSNLCEMVRLGLPVPPGFVITSEACLDYFALGQRSPAGLAESIRDNLHLLEKAVGRSFGSPASPLLVSVRSGAKVSMPGMMDTILNLGINDDIAEGLGSLIGDSRPAYDAYRRFLQVYAGVVMGVEARTFEEILSRLKQQAGVALDYQLTSKQLRSVTADFKAAIRQATGNEVPSDPWEQLVAAVEAVFQSWNNPRAIFYRDHHHISHDLGTAVTIMAMVFGNLGPTSGTGVLFTRNPSTGERKVYGEFLSNAQGEDVVGGGRTPEPISKLAELLPQASEQLLDLAGRLEAHYRDVQDIEFTIENSRLYILQTRNAKRTPQAAVRALVEMVKEGAISKEDALRRLDPEDVVQLLVPQFMVDVESNLVRAAFLARGAGASPGAAT